MTPQIIRWLARATMALALLPLPIGALVWASGGRTPADEEVTHGAGGRVASEGPAMDSAARSALHSAPFRPDGHPSPVAYDPARADLPFVEEVAPRPQLVLTGLVGGARPAVVISGVPGRDGAVLLEAGDTAGGIRVRAITKDKVTLTGMDTTWVLRVQQGP